MSSGEVTQTSGGHKEDAGQHGGHRNHVNARLATEHRQHVRLEPPDSPGMDSRVMLLQATFRMISFNSIRAFIR